MSFFLSALGLNRDWSFKITAHYILQSALSFFAMWASIELGMNDDGSSAAIFFLTSALPIDIVSIIAILCNVICNYGEADSKVLYVFSIIMVVACAISFLIAFTYIVKEYAREPNKKPWRVALKITSTIIVISSVMCWIIGGTTTKSETPIFSEEVRDPGYYISCRIYILDNNSVGEDWRCLMLYNGNPIYSGDKIPATSSNTFTITAQAIEMDDGGDDVASAQVVFYKAFIAPTSTKTVTLEVKENNGRFTGNTATIEFEITIEKIE